MANKLDLNIIPKFKISLATKIFIQFLIRINFTYFLGHIYSRIILKHARSSYNNKKSKIHILALSPERFRGDLEMLEKNLNIKIWVIPTILQTLIQGYFYKSKVVASELKNPRKVDGLEKKKERHRFFLKKIITTIFKQIPIDFVISADIKYVADIDWGEVSKSLGKSYVVFHRENLAACKSVTDLMITRTRKIGKFGGTHIIVQNQIMKEIFTDTGFAKINQVSVKGCLRMDELFEKVKKRNFKKNQTITLFSFPPYQWTRKLPYSVFVDSHSAFVKIAKNFPKINVIIKPKYDFLVSKIWNELMQEVFKKNKFDPKDYPNFSISPEKNSHDLILQSNIICAFNSTVILEALATNTPIILPYFKTLRKNSWDKRINFSEYKHLFYTPSDEGDLVKLLEKKAMKFYPDNKNRKEKKQLFKKYLHFYDRNVLNEYGKTLRSLMK